MASLDNYFVGALTNLLENEYVPKLAAVIRARGSEDEQRKKNLSRAFSAYVWTANFGLAPSVAASQVVDDDDDKGIDSFHYQPENKTLYFLQTKFRADAEVHQEEISAFCTGMSQLMRGEFEGLNSHFQSCKGSILQGLQDCVRIQPIVAFIGNKISENANSTFAEWAKRISESGEERLATTLLSFGAEEIERHLLLQHAYPSVDATLVLRDALKLGTPVRMYLGVAPLKSLADLFGQFRLALFAKNIRQSLGGDTAVNKAILATLRDNPRQFEFLNNGITIIVRDIQQGQVLNGLKQYRAEGVSVVNGAQTISTALLAKEQLPAANLDEAFVTVTIVKDDGDGEFGREITMARNHQNAVSRKDFAGLDPQHEPLRQKFAMMGIRYVYQTGGQEDQTSDETLSLQDISIAMNIAGRDSVVVNDISRHPTEFSVRASDLYRYAFETTNQDPYFMHNVVVAYKHILSYMNREAWAAPAGSEDRLVYRHGAHLLAWVAMRRLKATLEKPRLITRGHFAMSVDGTIDELRQQILDTFFEINGTYGNDNPYRRGPQGFFRNLNDIVQATIGLCKKNFGIPEPDPTLEGFRNRLDGSKESRLRLFSYLASKAPKIDI